MALSDSETLELLRGDVDTLRATLRASSGTADVVSYTTDSGRNVTRSRKSVLDEIKSINKDIRELELRENGPAINRTVLRRRP